MAVMDAEGQVSHGTFEDLPHHLSNAGVDGLWANDTRVLHARILATKSTGGQLEIFLLSPAKGTVEEVLSSTQPVTWKAMVRNAKRWSDGLALARGQHHDCAMAISLEDVAGRWHDVAKLAWSVLGVACPRTVLHPCTSADVHRTIWARPRLPPYMRRAAAEAQDREDYQTVFAMSPGSVAAPTAGLHYDDLLLRRWRVQVWACNA
jgi:S-adenosylmethionine:tRNA ribosyltransferase-isomerase